MHKTTSSASLVLKFVLQFNNSYLNQSSSIFGGNCIRWQSWICVLHLYVTRWSNSHVISGFCLHQSLLIFLFIMLIILCILLSDLFSPNKIHMMLARHHRAKHCRVEISIILILVSPSILGLATATPLVASVGISSTTVSSTSMIISPPTVVISTTMIIGGFYPTSIISVGL